MRKGLRQAKILGFGAAVLALAMVTASRAAAPRPSPRGSADPQVRLTVEVTWGDPSLPTLPIDPANAAASVDLEVTDGRVIDVQGRPDSPIPPRSRPERSWTLGGGPSGSARVRLEVPLSATLLVRAGGIVTEFPVLPLLEAPQRTAQAVSTPITVERLAWDSLEVRLAGDGTAPPGGSISATLGFNVLLPEPGEVALRYWAELRPARGGEPVWTLPPRREAVATNGGRPSGAVVPILMPKVEGTYVLEVHATWEPAVGTEGSRLARLLKRRRNPLPSSASRKVSLAVVGPKGPLPTTPKGADSVADSVDLSRSRAFRPLAGGRTPAMGGPASPWIVPQEIEAPRPGLLRGWMTRAATEAGTLGPADASGLAWSALPMKVEHPGRPHRLSVSVASGSPGDLAVALVVPASGGDRARTLLDASASGPAVAEGAAPLAFSWPVWPDSGEVVVVLVNRSEKGAVKLGTIELRETAADPAPSAPSDTHPDASRALTLHLAAPGALDRFGGAVSGGPDDSFARSRNLAVYLAHCGATAVVLPEDLADRERRSALEGQAHEDSTGPDRLDLALRLLARSGISAFLETRLDGPLAGLPAPESPEALARGLVRQDRSGRADGPAYQPLRGEVREAIKARLVAAIGPRGAHPNLSGLLVRLGPGATLPGGPEAGLDDATFARFVREAFPPGDSAKIPGQDASDPSRFAARWRFVTGPGRQGWLDWRADAVGKLYADLGSAVRQASPGASLCVVTPGLDDGPAGIEARKADRAGLSPRHAWTAVGLDLDRWPVEPGGPIVLRGASLSTDDLGHDLATSDDLDAPVASRPGRGAFLGPGSPGSPGAVRLTARPIASGPSGDELFGHALAVLDARLVVVDGSAASGQEDRLSRFARVFRALPSAAAPPAPRLDSGVAVRSAVRNGKTYVAMANDTPYTVLLESTLLAPNDAPVDDLGRRQRLNPAASPNGGRSLVLELPPFGVAAVRIGSPTAQVEPIGPFLPSGRDLEAQYERLSARLGRLAKGGMALGSGPLNPGFEAAPGPRIVPVVETRPARPASSAPPGWLAEGDPQNSLAIDADNPHSGRSALKLDARALPAGAASLPFAPPGGRTMTLHAWFRADRPDSAIRVWLEGDAAGAPFSRHADGSAGLEWAEVRLQAPELPLGGLDHARLRFEKLAAGTLWIDDVGISGDGPSEPARRAQVVLTAALHAYREKRYADFARLAGSHWARQIEDAEAAALAAERPPGPIRTGNAATEGPAGRRLR